MALALHSKSSGIVKGTSGPVREVRSVRTGELRSEVAGDSNRYLTGYTALYNSLSEDLGGWRERIMPGAFARAINERQDIRHLQNHDPNLVLGRTKAGTLTLSEDATGLSYRTLLPATSYANDLAASIDRGDVDEQSFGFVVRKQSWVKENGIDIRQLLDMDVLDISTVTFPAYPGTSAGIESRMFPDGVPAEIRSRMKAQDEQDGDQGCTCDCDACRGEDCPNCSNPDCVDENCADCPMQESIEDAEAPVGQKAATVLMRWNEDRAAVRHEIRSKVQPDGALEILLYGDIGESWFGDGITATGIRQAIDNAGPHSRIRLRISSMGGDAFEAVTIYNILRAQGKPIEVFVDGLAASAASVIAMAGDSIIMGANCLMMVHNASGVCVGDGADMQKMANVLNKISESIAQTYVARTGKSAEYIKGLLDAETWMSADECLRDGFCTAVNPGEEDRSFVLAKSQLSLTYRNLPAQYQRRSGPPVKRIDGEDHSADHFLVVGNASDPGTWKLPMKFSDGDTLKRHLTNNLVRFNETTISEESRSSAWEMLVNLCKEHGIAPSDSDKVRGRLTADQIYDLEYDPIIGMQAKARAVLASL